MKKPTWLRVISWLFVIGLCVELFLWGTLWASSYTQGTGGSVDHDPSLVAAGLLGVLGLYPVGFLFLLWLVTTIVYKFQVSGARLKENAIALGLQRAGATA